MKLRVSIRSKLILRKWTTVTNGSHITAGRLGITRGMGVDCHAR
jgi:hypothetical protein